MASSAPSATPRATQSDLLKIESLAERSAGEGQALFTKLSPQRTGITALNDYSDPRMWTERYQEMVFGTIGTGIAVADYDGDGLPDVFVAGKTGNSKLYRNLGDWRFQDVTESAGLLGTGKSWGERLLGLFGDDGEVDPSASWDQGAVFVDVNNDGWLDLYVTCFSAPNRLYMNQGDGSFKNEAEERGLKIIDASGVAAFCDYDRDGWLDVYIQTNMLDAIEGPDGRPDLLFRNEGGGRFTNVTQQAGISGTTAGHSVTWWDYDDDGWPDIYVANDFAKPDQLYRNRGDGTFEEVLSEVVPHMPYYSMGADLGDVNNDGKMDFLVGDMSPTTSEKDLRGMAVSRDREMGSRVSESTPQLMRNALYLNAGQGRMREAALLAGVAHTDWTWSVRFEDLDCDGLIDLHVTNGMVREFHNADILRRVMGAESRLAQRRVMRMSPVLAESNLAFRNQGDLEFERVEEKWGLDQVGVSFGAAFGDFDGDGDLDLVYANYDDVPTVFRNDAQSGGRAVFVLRGTDSNRYGVGATVRLKTASGIQTRQLVLARGYLSSSEPALHFGLGSADRIAWAAIEWPSGRVQVFENLPANRRFTITEPDNSATERLQEDPLLVDAPSDQPPMLTGLYPKHALSDAAASRPLNR